MVLRKQNLFGQNQLIQNLHYEKDVVQCQQVIIMGYMNFGPRNFRPELSARAESHIGFLARPEKSSEFRTGPMFTSLIFIKIYE
jgi:hypothetical protein